MFVFIFKNIYRYNPGFSFFFNRTFKMKVKRLIRDMMEREARAADYLKCKTIFDLRQRVIFKLAKAENNTSTKGAN